MVQTSEVDLKIRISSGFQVLNFFVSLLAADVSAEELGIRVSVEQKKLANGLSVILAEDPSATVVCYQTWYQVGSVDEIPGLTGISHLFEHLMFKGTSKYGPREFFRQLESRGAEVNAFTTRDYTVYYEVFVPELLEKVMDLESDRMTSLVLDQESLDHERVVAFEERKLRAENFPEVKIQESLWQLAFRSHPYHWPVTGFPSDLLNMKVSDLGKYYQDYYQPNNALVVIVGNFKKESALRWIKKYYEPIPKHDRPERKIPVEPEQAEERRLILRDRIGSEKFLQSYHIVAADHEDSYSIDLLSNILFEGPASRAYRKLVQEEEILTEISSASYTPAFPGLLIISGKMRGKLSSEKAEAALNRLINDIQNNGVTEDEVRTAVKQLTIQWVDSLRTPYGLAQMLGTIQTVFGNLHRFESDLAKYLQVRPVDIQKAAKKYLNPNNRSIVTWVPTT